MAVDFAPGAIIPIDPHRPQWDRLRLAARALRRGEVLAIPTDTLYGLAADAFRAEAVEKIFRVKRRPENRPIPLLLADRDQLQEVAAEIPPLAGELTAQFWPGPLTIIVRASPRLPDAVTAGTGTVAVRVPAAQATRALIREAGRPLTGTSANLSGRPPAASAAEVQQQLAGRVYYILDGGAAPRREPSTIVDLTERPRIVRRGAVTWTRLVKYGVEDDRPLGG